MADNETTTPQAPDTDDVIAVIDPKNEVALRAVLACKRRIDELEAGKLLQQHLLDEHELRIAANERRIAKLEVLLFGGANA